MGNKYYSAIDAVVTEFIKTLEDEKLTRDEIWTLIVVILDAVKDIYVEIDHWDDYDDDLIEQALQDLYTKYIVPIELPGPDRIIDRILRDMVIPNLVQGVLSFVNSQTEDESTGE